MTQTHNSSMRRGAFLVPVVCAIAIGVLGPLMGNYVSDFVVKVVAKDPALNSSAEREVRIYVTPVDEAPNAPTAGLSATWAENTPAMNLLT